MLKEMFKESIIVLFVFVILVGCIEKETKKNILPEGTINKEVNFNQVKLNGSFSDKDDSVTLVKVNWGDGENEQIYNEFLEFSITHNYLKDGKYLIELNVYDEKNENIKRSIEVDIKMNEKPIITIEETINYNEVNLKGEIKDNDGKITKMEIIWGDGDSEKIIDKSVDIQKRHLAVGIILSGSGNDGTLGIKEIKLNSGLTVVQNPLNAEFESMTNRSLDTGMIDFINEPSEMIPVIEKYFKISKKLSNNYNFDKDNIHYSKIFSVLSTKTGQDFSNYKRSTIVRRIKRRMNINQINDFEIYIKYLQENSKESKELFNEFLIGVTHFFREMQTLEYFRDELLENIINSLQPEETLRIWIPACSTGEEAYTFAIIIQEFLEKYQKSIKVQIFGTDLDEEAIEKARKGVYPQNIENDLSKDHIKKYFVKEGESYRVSKKLREMIIFSVQNIIKDPPFSKIHILSCRNLLIYLNSNLQKKILSLFHYTLTTSGILVLGVSETVGQLTELFSPIGKKVKIFAKQEVPLNLVGHLEFPTGSSQSYKNLNNTKIISIPKPRVEQMAKEAILEYCTPTSLLVNKYGLILYVQGKTGKYLETTSGPPTNNIIDMAREGLRIELSSALRIAVKTKSKIKKERLKVKTNGHFQLLNLTIIPLITKNELNEKYLVSFEDIQTIQDSPSGKPKLDNIDETSLTIKILEEELQNTRESHQVTIEELESTNEELQSSNEELQSTNEELQSSIEESESSKEELQSLNEELQNVNSELQNKIYELSVAHDDMKNLLNSIEIACIFVDNNKIIKRYTKKAKLIINFIKTDIGRPLEDISISLVYKELSKDIDSVLESLIPIEKEVCDKHNNWYLMRIIPYRTKDNRIDGAVITFSKINTQKKIQQVLEELGEEKSRSLSVINEIYNMIPEPFIVLDEKANLIISNNSFLKIFNININENKIYNFFNIMSNYIDINKLKKDLEFAVEQGKNFKSDKFKINSKEDFEFFIKGQVIHHKMKEPYRILIIFIKSF